MKLLRLLHRWAGGLVGLFLALLGLSGTILLHKDAWLRASLPHAADSLVTDPVKVGAAVERIMSDPDRPRSIIMATEQFGLHRLNYKDAERGAYADQTGAVVLRWDSIWERPEVWLFDFHHHLFMGDVGDVIGGVLAFMGLGFVVTGVILWWPTRRLFAPRLWPQKMTRPLIVRHHRDLGVLAAPVLFISLLTGATLAFQPFAFWIVSPLTPVAQMKAAQAPPRIKGGELADRLDWTAMLTAARARHPDAQFRILAMPAKTGALVSLRLRRAAEWLPNGRTMVWFDPANGRAVADRDSEALPLGLRVYNSEYPIHAAKTGGLAYRLVMTLSGVALTLLGTLAVVTLWGNPSGLPKRKRAKRLSPA
ncbi:PepSY-associated TM helix domain-containing protein [Caulobacter segnis]|uniref:PepSY-associated TM helix domain-containing protein n=1 Tax=Caulobacter segnis TaxID=88688 RepID=UPI002410A269|nr:PepSY-associated TM helix domain-containing protein [Caulobacter segnis]MDG2522610.1 PepSY-associated TM helix domain-containing protein [Caulobacter segnis]